VAAAAIRTSGLTKDYGGGHGLFDLDLQVSAREAFGLLGLEGAGKSTAIRLLMGMLRPTRGSAYVFGLDCFREAAEVKRRVGYVPDQTPEFGSMRGGEVVAYLAGLRGGVHKDRVRELAERFDLDLGRRHGEYSRDDRQKLSIVVAFMPDPDLLILDEPSQALDDQAAAELKAVIDEAREEGTTILLASHSSAEVERHCDAVGLLRRGKLSRVMRIEDLPGELEERSRKALPP
jgi:ABC-type multidrug transport system ATPase subunit